MNINWGKVLFLFIGKFTFPYFWKLQQSYSIQTLFWWAGCYETFYQKEIMRGISIWSKCKTLFSCRIGPKKFVWLSHQNISLSKSELWILPFQNAESLSQYVFDFFNMQIQLTFRLDKVLTNFLMQCSLHVDWPLNVLDSLAKTFILYFILVGSVSPSPLSLSEVGTLSYVAHCAGRHFRTK